MANPSAARTFARQLAEACARMEGFYVTAAQARARRIMHPTGAQRHNNPGNIMDLAHYRATGQFRLQQYATVAEGFRAAEDWWMRRIREGKTLRQAIHRYAPEGHGNNDPQAYTAHVARAVGIAADVPLRGLIQEGL